MKTEFDYVWKTDMTECKIDNNICADLMEKIKDKSFKMKPQTPTQTPNPIFAGYLTSA